MYVIDQSKLLKGDVLLTRENSLTSKSVRLGTFSKYSHAILYLGDSSFIHSDGDGVHSGNLQRLIFQKVSSVAVLRLKSEERHDHIDRICFFARTQVGKQYSVPQATASTVRTSHLFDDRSNRQYCSRLVAQAYEAGGLTLVHNADFCYPKELQKSPLLTVVPDCVRAATKPEIEFAESESPLEVQARATNDFLAKVRQIASEDVQTLEQVVDLLLRRQDLDDAVSRALKESGYLELWIKERLDHEWRYVDGVLRNSRLPRDEQVEVASREFEMGQADLRRFQHMSAMFQERWRVVRLKFFMLNIDLYTKLIDLQLNRIAIAEEILRRYSAI